MKDYLEILRDEHANFDKGKLDKPDIENPHKLFDIWYKDVFDAKISEPNAFILATSDRDLNVNSRIVYLKEIIEEKFIFYTNYNSQKSREIEQNPKVCMSFFWKELERQVRIQGRVKKTSSAVSDAYFNGRPRESKLGAWASNQSAELKNRSELEQKHAEMQTRFPNEVPRPDFWGGYEIEAMNFEFWQGRKSRLHDRIVFVKENKQWIIKRLNP